MPIATDTVSNWEPNQPTGSFGSDLIRAARDAYCELYRADPLKVRQWGVSNPVSDAIDGLNQQLCRRFPQPPGGTATVPFNGGQCPVLYQVSNTWNGLFFPGFSNPPRPESGVSSSQVLGPITSVSSSIVDSGNFDNPKQAQIRVFNASGLAAVLSSIPLQTVGDYKFSASRVDGGQDSCGSPVPIPPPDPLPFPNPGVRYVPVPLPGPGGGVYVVPVILKPIITLAPEINIQAGPFNISFGPFDVTIAPNFEFNNNFLPPEIPFIDPQPQPKPLPPGGRDNPDQGSDCPDVNLAPVINRINQLDSTIDGRFDSVDEDLEELLDCDRCNKEDMEQISVLGSGESGVFVLPDRTFKVRLVIAEVPTTERIQFGGNAPNILFIGSYAFGDMTGLGDRKPVSYQTSTFFAPENSNRFAFTLHKGCIATAIAYYLMEVEE